MSLPSFFLDKVGTIKLSVNSSSTDGTPTKTITDLRTNEPMKIVTNKSIQRSLFKNNVEMQDISHRIFTNFFELDFVNKDIYIFVDSQYYQIVNFVKAPFSNHWRFEVNLVNNFV